MDDVYTQLHDLQPDDPFADMELSDEQREMARAAYRAGFSYAVQEAIKIVAVDAGDMIEHPVLYAGDRAAA